MKTLLLPSKENRNILLNFGSTIILVFACSQSMISAQIVGPNDRIAYTADGNVNDPDDWSATPLALAMWADVGFQDRMVHFDYNSRLFVSKANKESENYESTIGAATRFGFDLSKFFNDQTQLEASVANLTKEINASSADSRLWVCMAGPFEVLYRALLAADEDKRQYCMMVTHSWVNEEADKWDGCHGRADCEALGAIYHPVRTGNGCTNAFGASGCAEWGQVDWLKDSPDEDFQWIYSRLRATWEDGQKLDASDCTMAYYLAYNDEYGSFAKLHYELGNCLYNCGDNPRSYPPAPGQQSYVKITTPENGARISTDTIVTARVEAWDDSGITSITLFLKDLRMGSKYQSIGTQTQKFVWNVGKLTYGTWVIRAAANCKDGDKMTTEFAIDVLNTSTIDTSAIDTSTIYTLSINNGKGSGEYYEGEIIEVEANAAPSGQVFDKWTGDIDSLGNVDDSITTFTMPPCNSTLTATYETVINTSFHNLSSHSTKLNVYPNPAINIIHIQGVDLNSNYEIYNLLGMKLQSGTLGKTIGISDLNPGVYYLFINNKASKFVKEL